MREPRRRLRPWSESPSGPGAPGGGSRAAGPGDRALHPVPHAPQGGAGSSSAGPRCGGRGSEPGGGRGSAGRRRIRVARGNPRRGRGSEVPPRARGGWSDRPEAAWGALQARGRSAAAPGVWADQRRDRRSPVHQHEDRGHPRREHLRQAPRAKPGRGSNVRSADPRGRRLLLGSVRKSVILPILSAIWSATLPSETRGGEEHGQEATGAGWTPNEVAEPGPAIRGILPGSRPGGIRAACRSPESSGVGRPAPVRDDPVAHDAGTAWTGGRHVIYTEQLTRLTGAPRILLAPGINRIMFQISAKYMRRGFQALLAVAEERSGTK